MRLERAYHDCRTWEEVAHNMWGNVADVKQALDRAIAFTRNHEIYGRYMRRVVAEWPVSCENALTDHALNKRAWVGHAAAALALNIPEDITRKAWGFLTDEQRLLANGEAERAIQQWQDAYAKNKGLRADVARQMLQ